MKKLLVLTLLAAVLTSASGCWHWFNRGAPCGSCGQANYGGDPYLCAPGATGYDYGNTLPGPAAP